MEGVGRGPNRHASLYRGVRCRGIRRVRGVRRVGITGIHWPRFGRIAYHERAEAGNGDLHIVFLQYQVALSLGIHVYHAVRAEVDNHDIMLVSIYAFRIRDTYRHDIRGLHRGYGGRGRLIVAGNLGRHLNQGHFHHDLRGIRSDTRILGGSFRFLFNLRLFL